MDGLTAACQAALNSGAAGTRHGAAPHLSILVDESTLAGTSGASGTGAPEPGASDTACTCSSGTPATGDPCATSSPSDPPAPPGATGLLGPPPARTGYGAMLTARQVLALACRARPIGHPLARRHPAGRRPPLPHRNARDPPRPGSQRPGLPWPRTAACPPPGPPPTTSHPGKTGGTTSLKDTALFCFVHHYYYIHLLGWKVTGDPNGTLHFTHPNGWLTLDSPLPCQTKPRAP